MSSSAARRPTTARDASPHLELPANGGGEFLLQLLRHPPRSSPQPTDAPFAPNHYSDPAVAAVGLSHSLDPLSLSIPPWLLPPVLPYPPRPSSPSFAPILPQIPQHDGWLDLSTGPHHRPNFQIDDVESPYLRACSSLAPKNVGILETKRVHENHSISQMTRPTLGNAKVQRRGYNRGVEEVNYGFAARNSTSRDDGFERSRFDVERVAGGGGGGRELAESSLKVEAWKLMEALPSDNDEEEEVFGEDGCRRRIRTVREEEGTLLKRIEESLVLNEEHEESGTSKLEDTKKIPGSRGKDSRLDTSRGRFVSNHGRRFRRAAISCRRDINGQAPQLFALYQSLIPTNEEKAKQKKLLLMLQRIVNREWPDAQLHLYGSCANSFGVSNSDIDVCLAIEDDKRTKRDILLKLADMLQSDHLENVQALTHARVPIVKLMDPSTGISCDICVNNLLAVVNTKLLRDYAQVDDRLRQLAFIVKHWAKSRNVNEPYQGTLSSYAYVLMCIHFLQTRRPAILPCLQEMEATYRVTVEGLECSFFDQVEKLRGFDSGNKETIAELVWSFFHYWAYCHDYANDVVSVRLGEILSKQEKDWTRRIGQDRHLICIEDPFETSHDLGRVVTRFSLKILREEFERAAEILQFDPNPVVTLFEPYVRDKPTPS